MSLPRARTFVLDEEIAELEKKKQLLEFTKPLLTRKETNTSESPGTSFLQFFFA